MDILEKLRNLHKQATTENSHFYVANTVLEAIHEIKVLRCKLNTSDNSDYAKSSPKCPSWTDGLCFEGDCKKKCDGCK